ncbi:23S rRNA (pseudouridine(1915)-N(3))-methyltransferase RlmH [uncultured Ruminococcus sp.]|uniref:23S rRNA (pseudouridine(1915)-N(3))-methyltransferase RlmH n=1 Tax=uncultured Ruminococcus sp. TaxID=165186 RepID=UPI0025D0B9CE|nr:23S rRNA (pseudouridine(1915)-N(3))-methyltransferase RlmH [uncultured Ruminococcus sp.]
MQTIQILALGKCKEGYLREACREYEKRLSRYCRLQITELEPAALSQNPSEKEIAAALEKEGAELLKRAKGYCIAMCIEGKQLTSPGLAEKLEQAAQGGDSGAVTFLIGSSYGLAPAVKQRAQLRLSMSAMTFPHQLARVMLLEQIYRGYQILAGTKYHK